MAGVTLAAPAKLNLRLRVGPRRDDGYHDIRSLMVTLDGLADTVTVSRAAERSVACPGLDGPANLAWAALDALERREGRALPCAVEIVKRIPTQAGLGGGSSDAAATLAGANRLLELGLEHAELESLAATIGSDVPFFVRGGCRWAEGRGERLAEGHAPPFAAVVAKGPYGLSTLDVYDRFDELDPPMVRPDGISPPANLAAWVENDLWTAAASLEPRLLDVAAALTAAGAEATLLCGSGSAVAGLVRDVEAARRLHSHVARDRPDLEAWVVTYGLGRPNPGTAGRKSAKLGSA